MRSIVFKKIMLALVCSAFSLAANASPDSDWVQVSETDTHIFKIRKGSFDIKKTKGGTPIAVVLGQLTNTQSKSIAYNQWYVSKTDCEAGFGKLVMLDTKGNYTNETDFVSSGDSVASGIADIICGIYGEVLKTQKSKGI